jgi:hypothetical protein
VWFLNGKKIFRYLDFLDVEDEIVAQHVPGYQTEDE